MIKVNRISEEIFDAKRTTSDNNPNREWEWVNDGSGDITVFIDREIKNVFYDEYTVPRYAWLLESRSIIPEIFAWTEDNADLLMEYCEGIFTCDEELAEQEGFLYSMTNAAPWVTDRQIYPKTKLVSMISSNKSWTEGHQKRLRYVEKFKNQVDLYGTGFNPIATKEDGLRDYMFSISIENADYPIYFTEKLTDNFVTGTVPIFYGSRRVSKYFNRDGIIFLDDDFDISMLSAELYHSMMGAIEENFLIADSMVTAEDWIAKRYL